MVQMKAIWDRRLHQDKGISSVSVPYLTASALHPAHSHSPQVMSIHPI